MRFSLWLHRFVFVLLVNLMSAEVRPPNVSDRGVVLHREMKAPTAIPADLAERSQSFFSKHCVACHGEEKQRGDVTLHDLDPARLGDQPKRWAKVVEVLKFRQMPPAGKSQPSAEAIDALTIPVQKALADAGHELDVDHRLQHPAYANLLDHRKLFDGSEPGPAYSPPRLWRVHPEAYENGIARYGRQLNQGGPLSRPFVVGDGKGLASNYAHLAQADAATLSQLMLNCRQIAQYQTFGFKKMEKDRKTKEPVERLIIKMPESFQVIIEASEEPTTAQMEAAVTEEFRLVLNRAPSAEELQEFTGLLERVIAIGGKRRGLRTLAMAVLLRPESIYRMEVGLGPKDAHGRRMLSPYELAHAIALALTDLPPDQLMMGPPKPNDRSRRPQPPSLLELAESGKLKTREDVAAVVTQIWDNEAIDKVRILRFFREFFGYHTAGTVFKGDRADRNFVPRFLIQDADQLVLYWVKQDREVLKQLLTTEQYFVKWPGSTTEYERRVKSIIEKARKNKNPRDVNYRYFITRTEEQGLRPMAQANPTWRQTVRFYNLDERSWDFPIDQPFTLPGGGRVGLLTHPAWLVAWSGNFENDPIRRGKWIREHLLAGVVPDVPITVNAAVPEDPHKTLRQRLDVTRKEYCWQCHQRMNPLGMPFEAFTDFGRFREREGLGHTRALGKPKNTAPLQTHGAILNSGDSELDGEVKDVRELMHRLAGSKRVRQSFVRHAFRFWMGRNEMMTDSPTLRAADAAYVKEGGSFRALVVSLLTSDSFLYRK